MVLLVEQVFVSLSLQLTNQIRSRVRVLLKNPENKFIISDQSEILTENEKVNTIEPIEEETKMQAASEKTLPPLGLKDILWERVFYFSYMHVAALYGLWLMFTQVQWQTNVFTVVYAFLTGFGITAGNHRLYTHRTYKAKLPLNIMLMIFNTMAFHETTIQWATDHRVHHKNSDTEKDPHNAKRGFFYCHIGWILARRNPEVLAECAKVDVSDLRNDKVVAFQEKYYNILMPLLCFILPTIIPYYCWGESLTNAWHALVFRYIYVLNVTWTVNSLAHLFGTKPFDKNLLPSENRFVAAIAIGEGFHNYHHAFPWDYKTAELGDYMINLTTAFIDFFAKIGWAYDLKSVSHELVMKRVERTGDGSYGNGSGIHPTSWIDACGEDKKLACSSFG